MFQYRIALAQMRRGASEREIARSHCMGRHKLADLRALAEQHGWLDAQTPLPEDAQIAAALGAPKLAASTVSTLESHRELIAGWLDRGVQGTTILGDFGLALHAGKTRLIEFGRFARENRRRRGQGKPETFDFLGFTHCCGTTRKGKFMVLRLTSSKRLRAKLHAVKDELRRRMHRPIAEQGKYLRAVVGGHARYFGVPCNGVRIQAFRFQVARLWHRTLCRRSQGKQVAWKRMHKLVAHWLPAPRICHPYPNQRLIVTTQGRSRMR